jgi:peroxiredoxin
MRRLIPFAALLATALPAHASLAPGAVAPDFKTRGALAGRVFNLHLKEQLKHGPVVLYFFPAAGTAGCNAEAKAFAEAIGDFKAAGARVIGMSADTVPVLTEFSKKECAGQFPVASAGPGVIAGYDVALGKPVSINGSAPRNITNRTSYVIAPDGKIVFAHSDREALPHVQQTLAAVRAWRAAHPR